MKFLHADNEDYSDCADARADLSSLEGHVRRYIFLRFVISLCYILKTKTQLSITKTRLFKYIENFTTKNENFQIKNSGIFLISARNIDCGYSLEPPRRGGSNEYPQSMFLSRNKKNNVYPCKPQFYYIKVGLRGSKLYRHVFVMAFEIA